MLTALRSRVTLTALRSHIPLSSELRLLHPGCFSGNKGRPKSASGIEGPRFQGDPSPAYGAEFSTDGNRLVRAMEGNGAGCRFTPRPVLPRLQDSGTRGRFPFPLPPRTVGEQKAKVKWFLRRLRRGGDLASISLSLPPYFVASLPLRSGNLRKPGQAGRTIYDGRNRPRCRR
jgi:hypothetical protein